MKMFKKVSIVLVILVLALAVTSLMGHHPVYADAKSDACQGVSLATGSTAGCGTVKASDQGVNNIVATVVNILSAIVGVVAVIMIIIGGFRFVLSGGDSNASSSARNTIIYAIVGLVIVAMAQVIVHFVLNKI